jgi:hypothetical protein
MFPRWVTRCGKLGITILAMRGMSTSYRGRRSLQEQNMGGVPNGPPMALAWRGKPRMAAVADAGMAI